MKTSDLSQYSATPTGDPKVFIITLDGSFVPSNAGEELIYSIADGNGNFALVTGIRTLNSILVKQLRHSTAGSGFPSFSGVIKIRSGFGGALINMMFGKGLLILMGESNLVGGKLVAADPELDRVNPNVTQIRYQSRDPSGTLYPNDAVDIGVVDQIYWYQVTNTLSGDRVISPATHAANALHEYGGVCHPMMVPGAQWATMYGNTSEGAQAPGGHWIPGGSHFERLVQMTIVALEAHDDNFPVCVFWMLGVNDALRGHNGSTTTQAQMAAWIDESIDVFRQRISEALDKDYYSLPFVLCTLPNGTLANTGTGGSNINNAIIDTVNRRDFVGILDTSDLSTQSIDWAHFLEDESRVIGRDKFLPTLFSAYSNFPTTPNNNVYLGTPSETDSAGSATAQLEAGPVNVATGTPSESDSAGSVTAQVDGGPVNVGTGTPSETDSAGSATAQVDAGDVSVNVGTASETDSAGSVTPEVGTGGSGSGVALDFLSLKDTGIVVTSAPDVNSWADQSGGAGDAISPSSPAAKPHESNGAVVTDGVDDYMELPLSLGNDNTNGHTFIFDIKTDGSGTTNPYIFGGNGIGARFSSGTLYVICYSFLTSIATTVTTADFADGERHILEIVFAGPGGAAEVFFDGASVGTGTANSGNETQKMHLGSNSQWATFASVEWYNIAVATRVLTPQERTDVKTLDFVA